MALETRITETAAPLDAFDFRWDVETEILAGRADVPSGGSGFSGSWELESDLGSVVTLETSDGVLCGIEVVVWPELEEPLKLVAPHDAKPGRVMLVPPGDAPSGLLEIETPIAAVAATADSLVHLVFGPARTRAVRVAQNVIADLDSAGRLTGLWLVDLPPFPPGG
jgi:hypothetical protein